MAPIARGGGAGLQDGIGVILDGVDDGLETALTIFPRSTINMWIKPYSPGALLD
jgi:hypothetical protein